MQWRIKGAGYNFDDLSCTPTYLNPQFPSFCIYKLMKLMSDSNLLVIFANKHVEGKPSLYAKMEKLAQICRCTRQGLKVMPCLVRYRANSV